MKKAKAGPHTTLDTRPVRVSGNGYASTLPMTDYAKKKARKKERTKKLGFS
jgi:hypothetical protein